MSPEPLMPDERSELAAEYAIGLLEGGDLVRARGLLRTDGEFAAEAARWAGHLAQLLEEIEPVVPPTRVLAAVEDRIAEPQHRSGNVYQLRRRVNIWRGFTAGASAIAASLALVLVTRPDPVEQVAPPSDLAGPMVATMAAEDSDARLVATWDPADRRLVVAAAGGMEAVAGHSHELWVIPAGGTPRSISVISGTTPMQLRPTGQVADELAEGATLAVSVEPTGGSPTGQPTGPVIAAGALQRT
ncbi:MAG: anti-sigma factor [Pseudomonadota bacterium]|nr:anti-sigma factor [Pseudomonadota bacterium]